MLLRALERRSSCNTMEGIDYILSKELEVKIKELPKTPGVYLMKNKAGTIIYVGKARVLKNRVSQYFRASAKEKKVEEMVKNISTFDYIITDTELEALVLENNLIKKYQPYYNILLKDDKQFPYVRIDLKDPFPRIEIVRKVVDDGAKYFGPYIAAHSIREVLDAAYRLFPIRSCKKDLLKNNKADRPCLNYQMGRCLAPCTGMVKKAEYQKALEGVIQLLTGKTAALIKEWQQAMLAASDALDFERAAVFRDNIQVLKRISEKQKASFPDLNDKDIFAVATGEDVSFVQAFFVRGGKLSHTERYLLDAGEANSVLESFLKQFYMERAAIPARIYVSEELEDIALLSDWLSEKRGKKTFILTPQRGEQKRLIEMAKKNAEEALLRKEQGEKREFLRTKGAAHLLGEILGIGYIKRMECFDISNTQGTDSVASMVVFVDGKPEKKEYRRFKIKTVEGPNDFDSMREVLSRRLIHGIEAENKTQGFGWVPDLIVVDGGKGQLSSAVEALESVGMEQIPIIGLAKKEEEIFLPNESEPIVLKHHSPELRLLTAIRDEAHRFAITFHRNLRQKRTFSSELDRIPGVGEKRKLLLIEAFSDLEGIKNADIETLLRVKGIDVKTAREIYKYFHL